MIKATDFQILRGLTASCRIKVPLERKPIRVATLIDEAEFLKEHLIVHHRTVFIEDRVHDWDWQDGFFRYYTRVAEAADVLVVYAEEDVPPASVMRFDPMTGRPLDKPVPIKR